MTTTLGDRLRNRPHRVYGRDELAQSLAELNGQDSTLVVHVHGVAGIGKSTLLEEVARSAAAAGCHVVALDCGQIEPTDDALLGAISADTGLPLAPDAALADQLSRLPNPLLIILDGYEVLWLLDSWLRGEFLPSLPDWVRVVFGSRDAPAPPWLQAREWQGAFRSIELGPLDDASAHEMLVDAGVTPASAARINAVAHGHPLALTLAAGITRDRADESLEEAATRGVIAELAREYLRGVDHPLTVRAVEAASVTRRTSRPILRAQLPEDDANAAYERLEQLPFVRTWRDGLGMHDAVREAVATRLAASDPVRHRELRKAAWRQLRDELRGAGEADLWRYTADVLYLMQNPLLREGFFPSGGQTLVIEPALPADHPEIRAITRIHDGEQAATIIDAWLTYQPRAFRVVRSPSGEVVAYRCSTISDDIAPELIDADPVIRAWLADLDDPVHQGLDGFFFRRWLSREEGEAASAAQGLCWIDCKSSYLKLRDRLGSVFVTVRDPAPYEAVLAEIGFRPLPTASVALDRHAYLSMVMDFGPGAVDGWFSRLVGRELGVDPTDLLDGQSHELTLDGVRTPLTPLEFAVMTYLALNRGVAVSHADLVEHVWGYDYTGESNVEAVVIRGIRSKLGDRASAIETVRGVGYRLLLD